MELTDKQSEAVESILPKSKSRSGKRSRIKVRERSIDNGFSAAKKGGLELIKQSAEKGDRGCQNLDICDGSIPLNPHVLD